MKLKSNKFALIYAALPAAGGFLGASLAGNANKNILLIFSLFLITVCCILAFILIKEIELNGNQMVVRKFAPTKETRIDYIDNIEISSCRINVFTQDGKNIKLNSRYIRKADLKEFNEYIVKHIN